MAEIEEAFILDVFRNKDSTNVNHCSNDDTILVTSGKRTVKVYNVLDKKVVKDWTLRNHTFSSPAVAHGDLPHFSAVIDHKTVRTWTNDALLVEKGRKITVVQAVHRLWVPADRCSPIMVHSDLSCVPLDDTTRTLVSPQLPDDADILWSSHISNMFIVCYNEKSSSTVTAVVYLWKSDDDSVSVIQQQIAEIEATSRTLTFSVCFINTNIHLFLIFNDGHIKKCSISSTSGDISAELFSMISTSPVISCCALDQNQLAIVNDCSQISIWDLKFGLQLSPQPCKVDKGSSVHRVGSRLYVPCAHGLQIYPVAQQKNTVASALGQLAQLRKVAPVSKLQETHAQCTGEVNEVLQKLTDINKTKSKRSFQNAFGRFSKLLKSAKKEDLLLLGDRISALVHRITEETEFWPDANILHSTIECIISQGNLLAVLMPALVMHRETDVICKALKTVTDVPEIAAIQALCFFLRSDAKLSTDSTSESPRKMKPTQKEGEGMLTCQYSPKGQEHINMALRISHNDVFAVEALQKMKFSEVLMLLKYLYYLMDSRDVRFESDLSDSRHSVLWEQQIVNWISQIIDAHLAQLLLSPDAKDIILHLHELVQSKMHLCKELVSLEGILWELKNSTAGQRSSKKAIIPVYSIHTLHIP